MRSGGITGHEYSTFIVLMRKPDPAGFAWFEMLALMVMQESTDLPTDIVKLMLKPMTIFITGKAGTRRFQTGTNENQSILQPHERTP